MGKAKALATLAIASGPEWLARLAFAGRRKVVDGRRIDPKAQALGELFNLVRVPGKIPTLAESRQSLSAMAARFDAPCPAQVAKRDLVVGTVPARMYDTDLTATDRPTLIYVHGGGWVQGDLDTHDGLCGQLAFEAGIRVIALDYRLAPEHKFPAAPDDVLAAYRTLRADPATFGVDPDRLAVGGDSAGGNLTSVLMHDLAEAGLPLPRAQLLIYPAVDAAMTTRSMQALRTAYVLPVDRIGWYLDQYLPDGQDRADPRVSPINSPHLAGQPPACVIVGGHDPLWDDGLMLAARLRSSGVPVDVLEYPGQIHVFVSVRKVVPQGVEAVSRASAWLRSVL
ncbi:MAG: alpha/beta hydrolase [Paracoccaceae bacterium]